jgi:protein-tyrosine phosphatase
MLDLHTHILPGIDDGAADLATAVALCRSLQQQGVSCVMATPHWRSPRFDVEDSAIQAAWSTLSAAIKEQVPGLELCLGAEHHCSGIEETSAFVASLRPLGESRLALIELPDDHVPPAAWATLFAVIRAGFRPILAHPERCRGLRQQREQVTAFVDAGGLLQLTLGSLIGAHGWSMRWHAHRLLHRFRGACVLASDSHDLGVRRPQWDRLPVKWRCLVPLSLSALYRWGDFTQRGIV